METDDSKARGKIAGYLKYEVLLLIGLSMILVPVLLFERGASSIFMISMVTAGFSLILLGVALYLKCANVTSVFGFALSTLAVMFLWFFEKKVTETVAAFYVGGIALILWRILAPNTQLNTTTKTASSPFFPEMRNSIDQISRSLSDAGSNLERLKSDLGDWAADNWNKERELKGKYHRVNNSLVLLLDQLEDFTKDHKESGGLEWVHERVRSILASEGIKEISVKKGDAFDGLYHNCVRSVTDSLPKGVVLSVISKGYYISGETEKGGVILRPADVIVSLGPQDKTNAPHVSKVVEE